jgi:hypothetical protein
MIAVFDFPAHDPAPDTAPDVTAVPELVVRRVRYQP